MRSSGTSSLARSAIAVLVASAGLAVGAVPAAARRGNDGSWPAGAATFTSRVFATGNDITHRIPAGRETISQPDDITYMNGRIYVGFQNGVGPQGQASGIRQHVVARSLPSIARGAQWPSGTWPASATASPPTHRLTA